MEICKRCKLEEKCRASSESDFCLNYEPRPLTRADSVRAMSDDELAEFFTPFYYDGPKFYCPAQVDVGEGLCAVKSDCRECFLDWLKQEVSE